MTLDDIVDLIADRVVSRLRDLQTSGSDTFSSSVLPPDVTSREYFNRVVKTVPGAKKLGKTWVVPKSSWFARREVKAEVAHEDKALLNVLEAAGLRRR